MFLPVEGTVIVSLSRVSILLRSNKQCASCPSGRGLFSNMAGGGYGGSQIRREVDMVGAKYGGSRIWWEPNTAGAGYGGNQIWRDCRTVTPSLALF